MKPTNSSNQQPLILYLILIPLLLLALWAVENPDVALPLMEQPILILPYLVEQFGLLKVIAYTVATISCFWFFLIYANGHQNSNVLRGAQVVPARRLKAMLKKQPRAKNQPQLTIAGMPIPKEYETLGFFMFGSPGSGKTQAISQMVGVLKQRTDFRGMVFDRNGEMLEKFYDPQRDLIFNPFDARSVHSEDFRDYCNRYNCWVVPPPRAASLGGLVRNNLSKLLDKINPVPGGNKMNVLLDAMDPTEILPLSTKDWIKSLPMDQQEKVNGFYRKLSNEQTKL